MSRKRLLVVAVVLLLVPVIGVLVFSEQAHYLRFRYLDQSTAKLPGVDVRFVGDWLPAADTEPGQVTASRFDSFGFAKPTHFITVQKAEFNLPEEVAALLPTKVYPWGEAKIVATKEARALVGAEEDADITALIPELNLVVIMSHLTDLDSIEVVPPERPGRVWG